MDINEALNLIAENLEDESVKRFMQPILDKYFSKGLATWKENHLPEEILKAMAPLETEEAKRIRRNINRQISRLKNKMYFCREVHLATFLIGIAKTPYFIPLSSKIFKFVLESI